MHPNLSPHLVDALRADALRAQPRPRLERRPRRRLTLRWRRRAAPQTRRAAPA